VGASSSGTTVYRVFAETDWGYGPDVLERGFNVPVSVVVMDATLASLVRDGDRLLFRSSVVVDDENVGWTGRLLQFAALTQIRNARNHGILDALTLEPAESAHPSSSRRETPDDILHALDEIPVSGQRSSWNDEEEFAQVAGLLNEPERSPSLARPSPQRSRSETAAVQR
jgi:hypothetical protein